MAMDLGLVGHAEVEAGDGAGPRPNGFVAPNPRSELTKPSSPSRTNPTSPSSPGGRGTSEDGIISVARRSTCKVTDQNTRPTWASTSRTSHPAHAGTGMSSPRSPAAASVSSLVFEHVDQRILVHAPSCRAREKPWLHGNHCHHRRRLRDRGRHPAPGRSRRSPGHRRRSERGRGRCRNLATPAGRAKAIEAVGTACGGSLDGLVAAAGLGPPKDPVAMASVNYFGAIQPSRPLRPALAVSGDAQVVAVSSNSTTTQPGFPRI